MTNRDRQRLALLKSRHAYVKAQRTFEGERDRFRYSPTLSREVDLARYACQVIQHRLKARGGDRHG